MFFLAGTETTSTAMANCTYILATHLDAQQKLYEEIDSNFSYTDELSIFDAVEKLSYLDMFIKEVMRMYPIAGFAKNRYCVQDAVIGKYQIQKGELYPSSR
jgi:cytochrome P450